MKIITCLIYILFILSLIFGGREIGGTNLFAFGMLGLFLLTIMLADLAEDYTFKGKLSFLNKRIGWFYE